MDYPFSSTAPLKHARELTRDELIHAFNLPMRAAAKHFGMCLTRLKAQCRRHNIPRWPQRQIDAILQHNAPLSAKHLAARAMGGSELTAFYEDLIANSKNLLKLAKAASRARKQKANAAKWATKELDTVALNLVEEKPPTMCQEAESTSSSVGVARLKLEMPCTESFGKRGYR